MPYARYEAIKKDFLRELTFLTSMGTRIFLCPFMGRSKTVISFYCFTCFLLLFTSTQLFVTLCLQDMGDWLEIINIVPNIAVVLVTALKYHSIHRNQKIFKKMFDHYQNELWDVVSDTEQPKRIVAKYTKLSRYTTRFLLYYSVVLVVVVNSFPRLLMYLEKVFTDKEPQTLYPFDGWYPFDKKNWYYAVYFWEVFMTSIVVYAFLFASETNWSFTIFMCMDLKLLGNCIENLITPDDATNLSKSFAVRDITNSNIMKRLKNLIKRHQFLAQMASEFDGVLGDQMLINYIFGSVFLTLTIFTVAVVNNFYKSVRYFFMFCSLLVEMFYQCLIGQCLSDHSSEITAAIYSADWPVVDHDTKMMLLIFMMRTQKPFQYTAKGCMAMNLQTFGSICSMSYQFFNLLYTAYG